ncbi:MAG: hypothetical protein SFT81_06315 [Candidatus Caenarcaniphilales bacterium]|nr:hypothetical protein [Candidatus Caenarcaniphilales bacterium]
MEALYVQMSTLPFYKVSWKMMIAGLSRESSLYAASDLHPSNLSQIELFSNL